MVSQSEIDKLKEVFERQDFDGIAHINFDRNEEDEAVLALADDEFVFTS